MVGVAGLSMSIPIPDRARKQHTLLQLAGLIRHRVSLQRNAHNYDITVQVHIIAAQPRRRLGVCDSLLEAVKTAAQRAADMEPHIRDFMFVIPKVQPPSIWVHKKVSVQL